MSTDHLLHLLYVIPTLYSYIKDICTFWCSYNGVSIKVDPEYILLPHHKKKWQLTLMFMQWNFNTTLTIICLMKISSHFKRESIKTIINFFTIILFFTSTHCCTSNNNKYFLILIEWLGLRSYFFISIHCSCLVLLSTLNCLHLGPATNSLFSLLLETAITSSTK